MLCWKLLMIKEYEYLWCCCYWCVLEFINIILNNDQMMKLIFNLCEINLLIWYNYVLIVSDWIWMNWKWNWSSKGVLMTKKFILHSGQGWRPSPVWWETRQRVWEGWRLSAEWRVVDSNFSVVFEPTNYLMLFYDGCCIGAWIDILWILSNEYMINYW